MPAGGSGGSHGRDGSSAVSLNAKAQLREEVKAGIRYALGLASTLDEARDKASDAADGALWRAVLAVARAERRALGGPAKADVAAARSAERTDAPRRAMALTYNAEKKRFLDARIAQLEQRAAALAARCLTRTS